MASRRPSDRWRGRPFLAAALRFAVFAVPLAVAVGASAVLVRILPPASGKAQLIAWWVLSFVVSTIVLFLTARLTRRAMPLAVLLRLSLAFPNEAPSRWKVARSAANVRDLESKVARARAAGVDDEPTRAAEHILELVAAVEAHDRATRGHSERVRLYTDLLAEELRLPVEARDRLRWASLLHDVGKLTVPARVLNKPSKPSPSEWELIKEHPAEGAKLIAPLRAWLGEWATAVDEHHERFDGTGYPHAREGVRISLGGRMLAVTDSFETMTAMRAYKRPMSPAKARAELVACAGAHFDPTIVRAFLRISVRRLGLLSGPLSWLAQLPVLRGIEVAAANAARSATATIAAGGTAFAIAVTPATAPTPKRAPAASVRVAPGGPVERLADPSSPRSQPESPVEPKPDPQPPVSVVPPEDPPRRSPPPPPEDPHPGDPSIDPGSQPHPEPGPERGRNHDDHGDGDEGVTFDAGDTEGSGDEDDHPGFQHGKGQHRELNAS